MKVYIVTKNRDFAEGRGPMLFHKAFITESKMIEYINSTTGIYGAKPREGFTVYEEIKSGVSGGWMGYDFIEVEAE